MINSMAIENSILNQGLLKNSDNIDKQEIQTFKRNIDNINQTHFNLNETELEFKKKLNIEQKKDNSLINQDSSLENENIDILNLVNVSINSFDSELFDKNKNLQNNKDLVNNSLMEFEENEKLAGIENNKKMHFFKSSFKNIETLIENMKNFDNYSDIDNEENAFFNNYQDYNQNDLEPVFQIFPNFSDQTDKVKHRIDSEMITEDPINILETKLENEIIRRQLCENKINELNQKLLELQQQLAIAHDKNKKKEEYAKKMDITLRKVIGNWKQKELEYEKCVNNFNSERKHLEINHKKLEMKNQLIQEEFKKLESDLINEKVKSQDYQNQIDNLSNIIKQNEKSAADFETKLEFKEIIILELTKERDYLKEETTELKNKIENIEQSNIVFLNNFEQLKSKNSQLNLKYDNLKKEYENLIEEAKIVVEESEKQHKLLSKSIESEKLAKDSLQVEINMLEEKYENTIKSITVEYENKLNLAKTLADEKHKKIIEINKAELDQIKEKNKFEVEKLKTTHQNEIREKINEYEYKIADLNFKIDSLNDEIERLKGANKDLENETNIIRKNLKQTLESQMKETMQLLDLNIGANSSLNYPLSINSRNNAFSTNDLKNFTFQDNYFSKLSSDQISHKDKHENEKTTDKFSEVLNHDKKFTNELKTSSPKQPIFSVNTSLKDEEKKIKFRLVSDSIDELINSFQYTNSISNKSEPKSNSSFSEHKNENDGISTKIEIKDAFILDQIDLINKYYQIDNSTLAAAAVVNSINPNSNLSLDIITNCTKNDNSNINKSNQTSFKSSLYKKSVTKEEKNEKQQIEKLEKNNSFSEEKNECKINNSNIRSNELKHYIQLLLNKSPSENMNENEKMNEKKKIIVKLSPHNFSCLQTDQKNILFNNNDSTSFSDTENVGYHDISDIDLGYKKIQSTEYYDDVKRNLNFDFDDTENEEEKINSEHVLKNKIKTNLIENDKTNMSSGFNQANKIQILNKKKYKNTENNQILNRRTNSINSLVTNSSTNVNKSFKSNSMKNSFSSLSIISNINNKKIWK